MTQDTELERAIDRVLECRLAPLLALDGATVVRAGVDAQNGCLEVRFGGVYRGAPCRDVVTQLVIAPLLCGELPLIRSVVWVD